MFAPFRPDTVRGASGARRANLTLAHAASTRVTLLCDEQSGQPDFIASQSKQPYEEMPQDASLALCMYVQPDVHGKAPAPPQEPDGDGPGGDGAGPLPLVTVKEWTTSPCHSRCGAAFQ